MGQGVVRRLTAAGLAGLMGAGFVVVSAGATAPAAQAEAGGVDRTPVMGWSSWSFLRMGIDTAEIEAEAKALVTTGLAAAGYRYVNIDDNWYECPGPQGPNVDQYGRWVINSAEFPGDGTDNGMQVVSEYVHRLGLKFGVYETPGISDQAVTENTPVLGTSYHADDIATTKAQNNYNCGGMTGLNYSAPGAQAYVDSVVDELASWGVDYIKLDGITDKNVADIQAWSAAIGQSGRPMVLNITQGSYTIKIAPELQQYANQWEFAPDIEINGPDEGSADACNAPPFTGCLSVFPLTSFAHWKDRFDDVAKWQPYGGPGGFNDYDSIEVGNGTVNSGMSLAAEQSQLSLWALGSAPLILGSDLTSAVTNAYGTSSGLDTTDLGMLTNGNIIEVDQDSIDASRIYDAGSAQIFAKVESPGDGIVGLFDTSTNLSAANDTISTTPAAIGVAGSTPGYLLQNVWTGQVSYLDPTSPITASVPSEGVALYRVIPLGA
jgi:Alpha galactosidase A/Alpha galactosidase C-terminal beta sandwich domain